MSKLAYCESNGFGIAFANGHRQELSAGELPIFRDICKFRTINGDTFCASLGANLQVWLLASGVFDLTEAPD